MVNRLFSQTQAKDPARQAHSCGGLLQDRQLLAVDVLHQLDGLALPGAQFATTTETRLSPTIPAAIDSTPQFEPAPFFHI